MHFNFSREDVSTRGDMLDQMLESAFEAAIIIDERGYISHCTDGACRLTGLLRADMTGKHISNVDRFSPVDTVLSSGRHKIGVVVNIGGKECVTNLFPIISDNEVIGIIGMVLFSSLDTLQNIVRAIPEMKSEPAYDKLSRINAKYTFDDYIGVSENVVTMVSQCRKAAKTDYPVLIIGETGTGKELIASGFHAEHRNGLKPFVKINCTAIPPDLLESELFGHEKGAFTGAVSMKKGKFELAEGGTLLLDEIGDMPFALQSKLLRVLEEKEYERVGGTELLPLNARIIASTNKNLRDMTKDCAFREDLYYRLSTVEVFVPPLKERKQDIPLLINYICNQDQLTLQMSNDALEILCDYEWPGNIRELKNVLYRLTINVEGCEVNRQDILNVAPYMEDQSDIETCSPVNSDLSEQAWERDRQRVIDALKECDFNVAKAAQRLNVCRATVYNKICKYKLSVAKVLGT